MKKLPLVLIVGALSACKTPFPDDSFVKGLEGCGGGQVEPKTIDPKVLVNLTTPVGAEAQTAAARVASKKPVVIYLTVDTGEPFMKLSVDHELRALRKACESGDAAVNWITYVNSHMTSQEPFYLRCTAGQFAQTPFPEAFKKTLQIKRDLMAAGKACTPAPNPVCMRVNQPPVLNPAKAAESKDFPLAHPDVMLDALEHARTVFPPDQYAYYIHLKSHGSEDFLTTGLGPEQVKEKTACQADVFKKLKETKPELFVPAQGGDGGALGQVGLGQVGLGQVGLGQVGLGQVGLGQVGLGQVGLGQVGLGQVGLGQVGLGQVGLGKVGGLGLGVAGLGAKNHYGMRHVGAILALRWFTTKGTKEEDVPFVFFESCESRASRYLEHHAQACVVPATQNPLTTAFNNVERVHAYYSASHSLWYRNLDWDLLYDAWRQEGRTSAAFQKRLIETTKLIPNYDFSAQDPLPVCAN